MNLLNNDMNYSDSLGASLNDNELKDFQVNIMNQFLLNTPDFLRAKIRVQVNTL